jgi:hypothetical protein
MGHFRLFVASSAVLILYAGVVSHVEAADTAAPTGSAFPQEVINGKRYDGLSRYFDLMNAKEYRAARNLLIFRFRGGIDPNIKPLLADAEIKDYLTVIANPKAKKADRDNALISLSRDYPEQAKPYEKQAQKADDDQTRARESKFAAEHRKFAAEAKKQGVRIGMSEEAALMSSWGRPLHRNRTTTQLGTREQWVYPGGNYLYFEDGTLTAIQN